MITLGVSLYPEQETLEEIDNYLGIASKYGFSKIFTSMFSVEGTKKEIIKYFKSFTDIAHKYNMKVSGDCNIEFFEKMGATERNLSIFKEMGIDIIRMDFSYGDKRDALLINNAEGIEIEMSAAFVDNIDKAIKNGADPKNISACHNFYPQRYTAPSLESLLNVNEKLHQNGVKVVFFISSQEKGTHGPWPVSDGLPTVEEHRNLPLEVQLKHCMALKNIDEVRIGNAYASEEEFKAIARVMEKAYVNIPLDSTLGETMAQMIPHGEVSRIPFKIHLEETITDIEKEILFDYPTHNDMGDCLNYMIRSRMSRMVYRDANIPERKTNKEKYTKGDIVIVNNNLKHYLGEIQIVLKDIAVDGQRNYLGRIDENEIMILDCIGAGDVFTFME